MLPLRDNVPTRTFPLVTVALIVANFIVWFWELSGRGLDYHLVRDGFYPCKIDGPCIAPATHATLSWWESTFTSMFMHGSWEHILGNMLFLWVFGNNVEDALGRVRFLFWYLAAGVVAAATQSFVTLVFGTVHDASVPNIGASGAIAGVLGAYFVLLPGAKVLTLIFFFILREIPAIWFLGIWILLQAWQGGVGLTHPDQTGGVAVFAHIGGFAFGILTVRLVAKRRPLQPSY
ncbi:MAG TPA: rhomboid family intramembrane serine protease [Gaiellaceae bacterium]|nr:rhomboid family intramembrane serine protease [Gaiellaceae bacterium]